MIIQLMLIYFLIQCTLIFRITNSFINVYVAPNHLEEIQHLREEIEQHRQTYNWTLAYRIVIII